MSAADNKSFVVSVFDVHKDNLQLIWPCLVYAVQKSSFVAIDCELSGLGVRRLIHSQAIDARYKNIGQVAKTRSIISLGLSCFTVQENSAKESHLKYNVQTFNFMALCSEEYTVEPSALQFLVSHGFDFQKQYAQGIPYFRGNDRDKTRTEKGYWDLRDMFSVIVSARVPIVLHNGLVDLVFLYQNLYAELPPTLPSFIADLEVMFPSGVFDTKYIAEYLLRMSASYLEFVFRSHQLKNINMKASNQGHVLCNHTSMQSDFIDFWDCSPRLQDAGDVPICATYISHGFCQNGSICAKSHDVFRAVVMEDQKKARKRKKKDSCDTTTDVTTDLANLEQPIRRERFKGHRAGHDAFMTGFCFASFISQKLCREECDNKRWPELLSEAKNRICLSGKDFPLLIQKSGFAKCSKNHVEKYNRLFPPDNAESDVPV